MATKTRESSGVLPGRAREVSELERSLDRAVGWMDRPAGKRAGSLPWDEALALRLLRQEAEALLAAAPARKE